MFKVMEGTEPRRIITTKRDLQFLVYPNGRIYRLFKHNMTHNPIDIQRHKYACAVQLSKGIILPLATIVAKCYVPNPQGYAVVRYLDGNADHCYKSNLTWATCSRIPYDTGLYKHKVFALVKYNIDKPSSTLQVIQYYTSAEEALQYVLLTNCITDDIIQHVASGRYLSVPNNNGIVMATYSSDSHIPTRMYNSNGASVLAKKCRCCGALMPLTHFALTENGNVRTVCKQCASNITLTRRRSNNANSTSRQDR